MKKLILILLLILLSGCIPNNIDVANPIYINDGDVLPENLCKNIENVIVIHKTGCPACSIALPRLEQLEEELGKEFVYLDTGKDKDRLNLLGLGFVPRYVPTIIVDCKVYGGALEKERYKELISEWLAA